LSAITIALTAFSHCRGRLQPECLAAIGRIRSSS